jgi:hypothetical protein
LIRLPIVDKQVIIVDRHPVLASPKTFASARNVPMLTFLHDAITSHITELALTDGDLPCHMKACGRLTLQLRLTERSQLRIASRGGR